VAVQGHCVVFLDKTLNSQSALLLPDVKMDTRKFNAVGLIIDRLHVHVASHPILRGVEILLFCSY